MWGCSLIPDPPPGASLSPLGVSHFTPLQTPPAQAEEKRIFHRIQFFLTLSWENSHPGDSGYKLCCVEHGSVFPAGLCQGGFRGHRDCPQTPGLCSQGKIRHLHHTHDLKNIPWTSPALLKWESRAKTPGSAQLLRLRAGREQGRATQSLPERGNWVKNPPKTALLQVREVKLENWDHKVFIRSSKPKFTSWCRCGQQRKRAISGLFPAVGLYLTFN